MYLIFFSPAGWQRWDIEAAPLIRHRMPVLIDEDLRWEDERGVRPAVAVNRWLRELPVSGAPSVKTWEVYARALKGWLEFLAGRAVPVFGGRTQLRAVLGCYAEDRLAGVPGTRWAPATWGLHVGVVAQFYEWAVAEGHAEAVPFSYTGVRRMVAGQVMEVRRNLAKLRTPSPHTTISFLEPDFAGLLARVLEGLLPDGRPDPGFRGLNPARNSAMVRLVLASGLRRQEFTYLLVHEVPALPPEPTAVPVLLPVAAAVAKGGKQRTTWVSYAALAAVHDYIRLERSLAWSESRWRPQGEPLVVGDPDGQGALIGGRRVAWSRVTPAERLRLVDERGRSPLLALGGGGAPFVDWATVLRRASVMIRRRFDERFPHVRPHMLRHSFALATLEQLVGGYYRQAAALAANTGDNPALALYLSRADPLMVLRDLLGHSSVTTTEMYLRRLDMTRVFGDAAEQAARQAGLIGHSARPGAAAGVAAGDARLAEPEVAETEVLEEFDDEPDAG